MAASNLWLHVVLCRCTREELIERFGTLIVEYRHKAYEGGTPSDLATLLVDSLQLDTP
jgi:hypothetical protein